MSETQELDVESIKATTLPAKGYAARAAAGNLSPFNFERRTPGTHDILADILYCGVCHSDLHFIRNDWGMYIYPLVSCTDQVGRITNICYHVYKLIYGE